MFKKLLGNFLNKPRITRKMLKTLPHRKWDKESTYNELYIFPSGIKHDSGFMCMAIVGIKEDRSLEVCAYPDDIVWDIRNLKQEFESSGMRTDCLYPEGVIRCWGNHVTFTVELALSSTTIKVENAKEL